MKPLITDRRQFGFTLGLGLLATQPAWGEVEIISASPPELLNWQLHAEQGQIFEHWTPEEDATWKWYRLERYIDGTWESIGISLPINKATEEPYQPSDGYLSPDRIPAYVIHGELPRLPRSSQRLMAPSQFNHREGTARVPNPDVQLRDGRPPSEWLRSLVAEELRTWLPIADAPEASVSGMTFWVHLVRDHNFDPRRIEGLTEHEFLLLHSAAHHGY